MELGKMKEDTLLANCGLCNYVGDIDSFPELNSPEGQRIMESKTRFYSTCKREKYRARWH